MNNPGIEHHSESAANLRLWSRSFEKSHPEVGKRMIEDLLNKVTMNELENINSATLERVGRYCNIILEDRQREFLANHQGDNMTNGEEDYDDKFYPPDK